MTTTVHATEIVSVTPTKATKRAVSSSDLDAAIERVTVLKAESSHSIWKLGREIAIIHDGKLWQQRADTKGHAVYKSYEAFVYKELGMTPQNANKLAALSKQFTEKRVQEFGTGKLGLILQAPAEVREELIEKAASGATTRDLAAEVAEINKKKRASAGTATQKDEKPAPKLSRKPTITVASIEGRKTVKLFCKPTKIADIDLKEHPRARKLTDHPFGVLELENDVMQYFTVSESPSGELVLVIETHRGAK